MLSDEPWQKQAACIGRNLDLWFPDVELNERSGAPYAPARAICKLCPVQRECLAFAMDMEHQARWRFGMFGGKTPYERHKLTDKYK